MTKRVSATQPSAPRRSKANANPTQHDEEKESDPAQPEEEDEGHCDPTQHDEEDGDSNHHNEEEGRFDPTSTSMSAAHWDKGAGPYGSVPTFSF